MSEEVGKGVKRGVDRDSDDNEVPGAKKAEYEDVQEVAVDPEISLPTTEISTEQDPTTLSDKHDVLQVSEESPEESSVSYGPSSIYSPSNMVNFQTNPAAISGALEMLMQMQQAFNPKMSQAAGPTNSGKVSDAEANQSAPVYLMVPSGTPTEYIQGSRAIAPRESDQSSPKLVTDREMQRKASHNEVERRRRERINELTKSLAKLIPACQKESSTSGKASLNKGFVLEKGIEYVKELTALNNQLGELVKNKEQAHNALQVLQGQITILEKENEFLRFQLKQFSMQPPTSQQGLSQLILQGLKSSLKSDESGGGNLSSSLGSDSPLIHGSPASNGASMNASSVSPTQSSAGGANTNLYLSRSLLPSFGDSPTTSTEKATKSDNTKDAEVE